MVTCRVQSTGTAHQFATDSRSVTHGAVGIVIWFHFKPWQDSAAGRADCPRQAYGEQQCCRVIDPIPVRCDGWGQSPCRCLGLASISVVELSNAPPSHWLAMWLGASWKICSRSLFLLVIPIFCGLLWSFQHLSPARLRAAGATAGLAAEVWVATVHFLHCPNVSAIFVLTWYTLDIALAAGAGALLGPRILRWYLHAV